jgi:hypothetical protein
MALNQDDFRRILATPRTTSGTPAPSLLSASRRNGTKGRKPVPHIRREGRSDVLEHSHVDLGTGFVDRAKERRLAELRGDAKDGPPPEVKGLDFELLKKVRAGEFKMPEVVLPDPTLGSDESDAEEDVDEDAVLEELLKMETELQAEVEKRERQEREWKEKVEKLEKPVEKSTEEKNDEEKSAESTKSRFKPVVDAKQLKQMRREAKRRKMATQAMRAIDLDRNPSSPAPSPAKTRADLLEKLRQIQAAKRAVEEAKTSEPAVPPPTENPTEFLPPAPPIKKYQNVPPPPEDAPEMQAARSPEPSTKSLPIRQPSPPRSLSPPPRKTSPVKLPPAPPAKMGDNMFSDSDLSDYDPYDANDSEDEKKHPPKEKLSQDKLKRNYFNETPSSITSQVPSSAPVLDPTIAAALRKATAAAAAAEKRVQEGAIEEKPIGRMSLGGTDGVYGFDEVDTWDGDDEDDDVGSGKKRKRKAKT